MYSEKSQATEQAAATLIANTSTIEGVAPTGVYTVECFDANGNLKWSDSIKNLVVTQGKNDMLDQYFAGISYTAAWYLGLVDGATSPTYAAGNTLASHSGWTENTGYSGDRPVSYTHLRAHETRQVFCILLVTLRVVAVSLLLAIH